MSYDCQPGCLFNLRNDPGEVNNLYGHIEYAQMIQSMRSVTCRREEPHTVLVLARSERRFGQNLCCDNSDWVLGTIGGLGCRPFKDTGTYISVAIPPQLRIQFLPRQIRVLETTNQKLKSLCVCMCILRVSYGLCCRSSTRVLSYFARFPSPKPNRNPPSRLLPHKASSPYPSFIPAVVVS